MQTEKSGYGAAFGGAIFASPIIGVFAGFIGWSLHADFWRVAAAGTGLSFFMFCVMLVFCMAVGVE
jgi:hypothetical protein